jgi:hypothetical protein
LFDCAAVPSGTRIPINVNYYPSPGESSGVGRWWRKRSAPLLSTDPVVQQLVQTEAVDVVLSSSSISTLLSLLLLGGERTPQLPVVIRNLKEQNRSVVFVDAPFIKKTYTPREKNTLFYTLAIQHLGLNAPSIECAKTFTGTTTSSSNTTSSTLSTNNRQSPHKLGWWL